MFGKAIRKAPSIGGRFLKKRLRAKDFYLGLVLLGFSLTLVFWLIPAHVGSQSGYVSPGVDPTFLPYCITVSLGLLSIGLIHVSPRTSKDVTRVQEKRVSWFTFVWIPFFFGYYYGVRVVGMVPASILALFLLMRMFGFRRLFFNIFFTLVVVFALFFLFEILARIPVPRGTLFGG